MIRALLDGRKVQTRRVLKPPKPFAEGDDISVQVATGTIVPKIVAGDRLWVKETWRIDDYDDRETIYVADVPADVIRETKGIIKSRPSIFMPRTRSRLTLIVTDVRVQRLQDISEEDAEAEGLWYCPEGDGAGFWFSGPEMTEKHVWGEGSVECYARLWDHINGKGAWDANPWVAAYTFEVHKCNIDAMEPQP
jgi:hypothetical protein